MRIALVVRTLTALGSAAALGALACRSYDFAPMAGCDFDDDASAGVQGSLAQVYGDGQTAPAGAQLYLVAHLIDVEEEELCDKTITWTPGANSGSVNPGQSLTDDFHGSAATVWTLGSATGTQTITATVENSVPTLSVVFTATVTPAGTYHLVIVSGDHQSAKVGTAPPQPLVVKFADVNGNPGPATALTWQPVYSGNGRLTSQPGTTTDAATGLSDNTWILGDEDNQAVIVSEPDGTTVVFTAKATLGANYHLEVVSGDHQSAPKGTLLPHLVVVKFVDAHGSPGPATALKWETLDGGTLANVVTTTDPVTGLSQNTWTLGPGAGLQDLDVSATGGGGTSFTATATGSHSMADISAYNGTTTAGVTVSLQTPYDGVQTFGPLGTNQQLTKSLQVEVGQQFTASATIGGQTGSVLCITTAAIIPDPNDPLHTGSALVAVFTDGAEPILTCNGSGWH